MRNSPGPKPGLLAILLTIMQLLCAFSLADALLVQLNSVTIEFREGYYLKRLISEGAL